jgi:hypothetical protein
MTLLAVSFTLTLYVRRFGFSGSSRTVDSAIEWEMQGRHVRGQREIMRNNVLRSTHSAVSLSE